MPHWQGSNMHIPKSHQTSWVKSSFSGTTSANSVEVRITEAAVLVRDSKNQRGPWIHFGSAAWHGFLDEIASQ
jgi:hypothetical protein